MYIVKQVIKITSSLGRKKCLNFTAFVISDYSLGFQQPDNW